MAVTNRQLGILAIVAGILLVVTVLVYGVERRATVDVRRGALLVQGLELDKVAKITVTGGDKVVTLEKKGKGYVVAERKGYSASVKKVNELLIGVLGIRLADKITASADNHKELGVDEGGEDATVVEFLDKDGRPIVGAVIGKNAGRASGRYVRLADQDTVYASEKGVRLTSDVASYVETALVDVKKDDVEFVAVTLPDEGYKIERDDGKKIVLSEVPEGKKQKDWDVESTFHALSSFSFSDVAAKEPGGLKFNATYVCETKNHLTYTVRLAKKDDKHYARLTCRGPSRAEIERARLIDRDEPEEKLKEKDNILTAADKGAEFNEKHGPWLYELSSWQAEKMRKPIGDLTEDEPKDEGPEEIAASHILVAYKGAEGADDGVARSKDEAERRAEELLKRVTEEGADFAETAREESDGPSKDKGGNLGAFKKGKMHKNFEEAVWKLEVDDISDVVETPFGFHIIKRTE